MLSLRQVSLSTAVAITGIGMAFSHGNSDKLQRLVGTSARRLEIARQISFAKWDTATPVEDTSRETAVITAAVKAGQARGLDPKFLRSFFRAQIEANKLVQYSLLANWHRAGSAPPHAAANLAAMRVKLDVLQQELIGELAETEALRRATTCQADTAKAVAEYVAIDKIDDPLFAIALDRAMAGTCLTGAKTGGR